MTTPYERRKKRKQLTFSLAAKVLDEEVFLLKQQVEQSNSDKQTSLSETIERKENLK